MSRRLLVVSLASINEPHRRAYDTVARLFGWEVHIAAPESMFVAPNRSARIAARPTGAQYELHPLRLRWYGQGRLHWYSGLERLLVRLRPDIVFAEYDPGSLAVLHSKTPPLGQKVIAYTVENIVCDRHRDYTSSWRRGRARAVARDAFVGALSWLGWAAADGLACISPESRRIFESQGWCKPIEVMPLGTDIEAFCPGDEGQLRAELGLTDAFVVGYFGRLAPEKGVHLLIDAVSRMTGDVMLLVDMWANFAPGNYAGELMRQAERLGIRDHIRTVDIPHAEVPRHMRCCDVVVLPSLTTARWKEQFGRVLPEAMACEVPVIGTSSGNIPDLLGDAGVIVREDDSAALAAAIQALRGDSGRRQSLGRAGRARVIQHFSLESQARALGRLAEKL